MKETAKRLFALVLALTMVCGLLPVNALATEVGSENDVTDVQSHRTYVNPLYADVATDAEDSSAQYGVQALSDPEEFGSVAEAAKVLRAGMRVRQTDFSFSYTTSADFSEDELFAMMVAAFEEALAHTGNPVEGDYIRRQYERFNYSYGGSISGNTANLTLTYTVSYFTDLEQEADMDVAVAGLVEKLGLRNSSYTDYEKIKLIYDWMCANISYDYTNLNDDTYRLKYTAYAALINKTAVCQGYANLLYRLALHLGIDCRIISGISNGGGHSWNIVKLGDAYYNLDATWDRSRYEVGTDYDYFLRSSANFGDHTSDAEYLTGAFTAAYPISGTDYNPTASGGGSGETVVTFVASGECGDDLTWALNSEGTLTISGTGAMDDLTGGRPWDDYSSKITKAVVEPGVTSVGSNAFMYCSALESVSLPDGLTSIGGYAFYGCSALTEISLPDSLTGLGTSAFDSCTSLSSIVIPGSVQAVERFTFEFCSSLTSVTIGEGVTSIGTAAFENCHTLTDVTIPGTVTSIGDSAFYSCRSLARVTIPASVTSLGSMAFGTYYSDRVALEITFEGDAPEMIPTEEDWFGTFQDVTATAYYPADNATWTEEVLSADYGGTITWVAYGDSESGDSDTTLPAYGSYGDVDWEISTEGWMYIYGTGDMEDQTDASGYPWYAYKDQITRLFINGITSVGDHAFENCTELEYFSLNDVTRIGEYAFAGCTSMTDCNMSEALTSIEAYAFKGNSIFYIQFHSDPPAIDATAFTGVTADCQYPYGNENWTGAHTLNYGGTLTWSEAVGTVAYGEWEGGYWEVMTNGGLCIYNWSGDAVAMTDQSSAEVYPWYTYRDQVTYVYVGEAWSHVGAYAFSGYPYLEQINVGHWVASIGAYAFADNTSLRFIEFMGDAPTIDNTAFMGVTARAYYYSDMSSWTDDVMLDYGGDLSWAAVGSGGDSGQVAIPDETTAIVLDQETTVTISEAYDIVYFSFTPTETGYYNIASKADGDPYCVLADVNGNVLKSNDDSNSLNFSLTAMLTAGETYYYQVRLLDGGTGSFTILLTQTVPVTSGACGDNLTWNFDMETGTLTISGTGAMYDFGWSENGVWDVPWAQWRNNDIKRVVIEKGVTTIGDCAFSGCYALESAEFPEGLISIGALAFQASWLAEFTLPSTLTTIGASAFEACHMTSVTIPAGVTSIGDCAFEYCYNVTDYYVAADNAYYAAVDGVLFSKDLTKLIQYPAGNKAITYDIPDTVTTIGYCAMSSGTYLQSVTIGANVTTIERYAFIGNEALKAIHVDKSNSNYSSVDGVLLNKDGTVLLTCPAGYTTNDGVYTVPNGVETIETESFRYCNFTKIVLPDSVKTLNYLTFTYMWNMKSIDLGSVQVIGDNVFQGCSGLTSLTIPATVTQIGGRLFTDGESLDIITFLGDAPALSEGATWDPTFANVTATAHYPADNTTWTEEYMESLGGDITWIGYESNILASGLCGKNVAWTLNANGTLTISASSAAVAFSARTNTTYAMNDYSSAAQTPWYEYQDLITTIVVEETVDTIGSNAFSGCTNLMEVVIEGAVESIGSNAFANCESLTTVTFEGDAPASVEKNAFSGTTATVTYPADNDTWTDEDKNNYGGNITWEESVRKFDFYAANVIMGNNLDMMFAVAKNAAADWTGHYIRIVREYADGRADDVQNIPYEAWEVNGSYYVVTYKGLAAKEMCDTITLTVYNAEGQAVSNPWVDSMRAYAMRILPKTSNAQQKTLMVDMLNYGAAAQTHFGYNTEDLANILLSEEQKALATDTVDFESGLVRGDAWVGSNLILKSNIQFLVAFKGLTNDMTAKVEFTKHNGNVVSKEIKGTDFGVTNGMRYVDITDLVIADVQTVVSITIYNADGTVYTTCQESIEDYLVRMDSKSDLFEAIMKFADSAYAYLHRND